MFVLFRTGRVPLVEIQIHVCSHDSNQSKYYSCSQRGCLLRKSRSCLPTSHSTSSILIIPKGRVTFEEIESCLLFCLLSIIMCLFYLIHRGRGLLVNSRFIFQHCSTSSKFPHEPLPLSELQVFFLIILTGPKQAGVFWRIQDSRLLVLLKFHQPSKYYY